MLIQQPVPGVERPPGQSTDGYHRQTDSAFVDGRWKRTRNLCEDPSAAPVPSRDAASRLAP